MKLKILIGVVIFIALLAGLTIAAESYFENKVIEEREKLESLSAEQDRLYVDENNSTEEILAIQREVNEFLLDNKGDLERALRYYNFFSRSDVHIHGLLRNLFFYCETNHEQFTCIESTISLRSRIDYISLATENIDFLEVESAYLEVLNPDIYDKKECEVELNEYTIIRCDIPWEDDVVQKGILQAGERIDADIIVIFNNINTGEEEQIIFSKRYIGNSYENINGLLR